MGFLDDISVAFSKGASRVEDGAKTLKLKTDLADARNRRDRMMGELGRQVYPLIADKPEFVEGREELFSDIAAVDGEIAGIENQIAEVERAAAERKAQEEAAAQQRAAAQAAAAQSAAQAVSQATGAPMPAGYATVSQPVAAACPSAEPVWPWALRSVATAARSSKRPLLPPLLRLIPLRLPHPSSPASNRIETAAAADEAAERY